MRENIHVIKGTYEIIYKNPKSLTDRMKGQEQSRLKTFKGVCENFLTSGTCAFSNEKGEILLVNYNDIVQMSSIETK